MGTIGRNRFAGRVAQPGADVEELPSFPPGEDERVFRCRVKGETPCQVGGRRLVPNQSMEIVLFGAEDAAKRNAQHWQPRQGRVGAACCEVPTRPVGTTDPRSERVRLAAQSRVQREQVSRARQALIGAALAPRNSENVGCIAEQAPTRTDLRIPHTVSIAVGPKVVREVFA